MTRAIICGAGIGGLAVARQLGAAGWECILVEQAPSLRGSGYMIDFFGPGYGAIEAMGLLPRLRELACPIDELTYVDRRGRRAAALSYRRLARPLGGRLLSIMRGDLEAVLYQALTGPVEIRFGCTVHDVAQSPDGVEVGLSDGSRHRAALLVGADGVHSRVRELVFGSEYRYLRYLGFHAAAFSFSDPALYQRLAGRFTMTDSVDRLIGLYGTRGGQIAVLAVHRSPESAIPRDPQAAVRRVYRGLGWEAPRALGQCPAPPALYYDLVAQIRMRSWTRDRVTLVGDACHTVSLLAGQGASLALAGAYLLAAEVTRGDDLAGSLERYQSRLLPLVRAKQAVGRRTAEWFLPSSRSRLLGRHLALHTMRLPVAGTRLVTALVGDHNDLPGPERCT